MGDVANGKFGDHACEFCADFGPFGRKSGGVRVWRCRAHVWPDYFPKDRARLAAEQKTAPVKARPLPKGQGRLF